jgi:chemosensory pili system protein ChpA (sensor histidine kinase/response regulator)
MLTIEIVGALALLLGLLIYAMVRTQLRRRELSVLWEAIRPTRILIVDDDPDFVKITKKVLAGHGYETYTSPSGAEALKIMRSAHFKPDLVLLDIMMDYMTEGFDVSSAMRWDPTLRDIPVIMITSLTGVKSQEIFPSDEYVAVSAWLSKPVQPKDLLKTVEETLAGVPAGVPVGVPAVS